MKKTILTALVTAAAVSAVQAATTVTATNYNLGTVIAQQVVTDSVTKTPLVGSYMIGTFTTTTGLDTTAGPINLATYGWSMFGSAAFEASANRPGLFGSNGVTADLPTTNTGLFVGKGIFVVVPNAGNTDYIIWNSAQNFAPEIEGVGGASIGITTYLDPTTLLRGISVPGGNNGLAGAISGANDQDAVTFGVVPEPSAALLGAIGALGLLRRRR